MMLFLTYRNVSDALCVRAGAVGAKRDLITVDAAAGAHGADPGARGDGGHRRCGQVKGFHAATHRGAKAQRFCNGVAAGCGFDGGLHGDARIEGFVQRSREGHTHTVSAWNTG